MIRHCPNCKSHDFQDQKYGNKMRVYTKGTKKEHKSVCSVCEKEYRVTIKK